MSRRVNKGGVTLTAVAALMAALTSCTTPGTPAAIDSERPSVSLEAPEIPQPLAVDDYDDRPCETLTAVDIIELGVTNAGAGPQSMSRSCIWVSDMESPRLTLRFGPFVEIESWSDFYRDYHDMPRRYAYFVPTTVSGHPAVLNSRLVDTRDIGSCGITIGIADDRIFNVEYSAAGQSPDDKRRVDPCGYARRAAEMVIERLRQG